MNLSEIPTPENDRLADFMNGSDDTSHLVVTDRLSRDLERRLTVAREALKFYEEHMLLGYGITDSGQVATEALTQTAPKP